MQENDELQRLADASEADLYLELGQILTGRSNEPLRDGDIDDLRRRAANWLERNREVLRQKLCVNGRPIVGVDSLVDIATIADVVATTILNMPGALVVAAILVKQSISKFCE